MTGASSPEPVEKVREKIHVFFLPKTHVCYIAFLKINRHPMIWTSDRVSFFFFQNARTDRLGAVGRNFLIGIKSKQMLDTVANLSAFITSSKKRVWTQKRYRHKLRARPDTHSRMAAYADAASHTRGTRPSIVDRSIPTELAPSPRTTSPEDGATQRRRRSDLRAAPLEIRGSGRR